MELLRRSDNWRISASFHRLFAIKYSGDFYSGDALGAIEILGHGFDETHRRFELDGFTADLARAEIILKDGYIGCVVYCAVDTGADVYAHSGLGRGFIFAFGGDADTRR